MSETIPAKDELTSSMELEATPYAQLALEGLLRVADASGKMTRRDALDQHTAMFPDDARIRLSTTGG